MTITEALAVVGVVRRGAIPQEMADERIVDLAGYLLPLPYEYCRRAAERWCVSVPVDDKGQPVPKFVSEPAALLTACGVPFAARSLLDLARRDWLDAGGCVAEHDELGRFVGVNPAAHEALVGEVFPSMRGEERDGGWEYVLVGEPLTRGIGEYFVHAGIPLPPGRVVDPGEGLELNAAAVEPVAALPPPAISAEQAKENRQRFAGLARELAGKRAAR